MGGAVRSHQGVVQPCQSWLLARFGLESRARPIAVGSSIACAVVFSVVGVAVLGEAGWAPGLAIAGAVLSLLLTTAYFHPWLSINIAMNAAISAHRLVDG